MNWLERARCEIGETSPGTTANSADGNPAAVTAVPNGGLGPAQHSSIVTIGSSADRATHTDDDSREAFEERAAIVEFDGGLSRASAERMAWRLISPRRLLN